MENEKIYHLFIQYLSLNILHYYNYVMNVIIKCPSYPYVLVDI